MSIIAKFNSKLMVLERFFKQATKSNNADKVLLSQQINKSLNNSNITPFCQEYLHNTDFMSLKPRGESVRYHEYLNAVNEVGIYDMVITYENDETNLKESIIIN